MSFIIGVRFRNAGRSYYYDPGELPVNMGAHVIVESAGAVEYGTVSVPKIEMDDEKLKKPLAPVIRIATEEDEKIIEENKEKEKEALRIAKEKVREHGLEMKMVQTEYSFERNKILFYFTAEGRVDFRNLVKDLAAIFKTRIELRQIGVRDETRVLGGLGICGRELCCKSFLTDFAPVSIKMAKEQNLSLNPTKISGVCGRLMCCLTNEAETYEYLNKQMPGKGDGAITEDGEEGIVIGLNVLRQKVSVLFEENDSREIREYDVADLRFIPRKRRLALQKEKEEGRESTKDPDEYKALVKKEPKPETEEAPKEESVNETAPDAEESVSNEKSEKEEAPKADRDERKGRFGRDRSHGRKKDRREDGGDKKNDNLERKDGKEAREGKNDRSFRDKKDRRDHHDKNKGKEGRGRDKDFKNKKFHNDKKEKKGPKDLTKRNGGYRPYQHKDNDGGSED